jgi:DNA-nicking Smr family endonuclease
MAPRRLRPEEARLWAAVARTVSLAPGMVAPEAPPAPPPGEPEPRAPRPRPHMPIYTRRSPRPLDAGPALRPRSGVADPAPADAIEPNRKRRIVRAPEAIAARLDLHGLDQDRARAVLHAFLHAAVANNARAVLVITGKGRVGVGVLKARVPEWLMDPAVRPLIAGVSQADRRHGGDGALYVALKRRD